MWLLLVAAETPEPTGASDQLIIMIGSIVTAAIVMLGGVLVAIVNSRSNKTAPSPPSAQPPTSHDEHLLYERTAVLTRRADDSDDRFDVMDRRLDAVERRLDRMDGHDA